MTFVDQIVGGLNDILTNLFPCERRNVLGVAQSVRLDSGKDRSRIVPGVFKAPNDVIYAGFDDNYALCCYHRIDTMTPRKVAGGYGDNEKILLSHNMQLVVCANTVVVKKDAAEIALNIQFAFPERIKPGEPGFDSIAFNVNSINLNAEQVFAAEFKNVPFFLGPEHALLKVQYTIESTMNKRCYEKICQP
jgi:hypothetical protein